MYELEGLRQALKAVNAIQAEVLQPLGCICRPTLTRVPTAPGLKVCLWTIKLGLLGAEHVGVTVPPGPAYLPGKWRQKSLTEHCGVLPLAPELVASGMAQVLAEWWRWG